MNRIPLKAEERTILGKKVNSLRKTGFIPGHVFGKGVETEHVSVKEADFIKVLKAVGETGLVDLRVGEDKIRPVLIRDVQVSPVTGRMLNIDFYQVNLTEKTTVNVPVILTGDEPEIVHSGEAVVIQPMMEVMVEALPGDLPEKIEVDITSLKAIDDAISVSGLNVPEGVTILVEPESVVVKLDTAITEEMKKLMKEQAAEAAAAASAEIQAAEGEEAPAEGEEIEAGEAETPAVEKPEENKEETPKE